MGSVVHFEIHAEDVPRAVAFYVAAFGWQTEDWSSFTGSPYIGLTTHEEGQPGISGAVTQREGANPPAGSAVQGAVLTVEVDDFDIAARRIEEAGGTVAMPKFPLTGMAWQGYFVDTEGNVFGIHQPDETAGL